MRDRRELKTASRYPASLRAEAVRRYAAGLSAETVSRELGPSVPSILRWAREADVEVRPRGPTPALLATSQLAVGWEASDLHSIVVQGSIANRPIQEQVVGNGRRVDPDLDYWVGFALAEASVKPTSQGSLLRVSLPADEADFLACFADHVHAELSVHGATASVEVSNPEFVAAVQAAGLPAGISQSWTFDDLSVHADFWRGVIDGDGEIAVTQHLSVSGETRPSSCYLRLEGRLWLCEAFRHACAGFFESTSPPRVFERRFCYRVQISGVRAYRLVQHLYVDSSGPRRPRRAKAADRVLSLFGSRWGDTAES